MRLLLFSIDRLELVGNGEALLGGRCCADDMLPGDTATEMVLRTESGQFTCAEVVDVRFDTMNLYGKPTDHISSGLTARVTVPVSTATGLRLGWYLRGQNGQPDTAPNGGPAMPVGNSTVTEGPPSVS